MSSCWWPAPAYVTEFLATFKDYPQRQEEATFNLGEFLQKMKENEGGYLEVSQASRSQSTKT